MLGKLNIVLQKAILTRDVDTFGKQVNIKKILSEKSYFFQIYFNKQ